MDLRSCGFYQQGATVGLLGFAAKAISCMTVIHQPGSTGSSSITIPTQQTSTVMLQHLSSSMPKNLKEQSCVTSAVFTTTVAQLFEDQYMKRMSVI